MGAVLGERLRRQRLVNPVAGPEGYLALFEALQPLPTLHNARPGAPPRLVHRTAFDDAAAADALRPPRTIVKGRFLGGRIGYVLAKDLELYANAFRRPLDSPTHDQRTVLDALATQEPLTPRQVKVETGLLNRHVMPALHRLQEAFLAYEDQPDEDWERGWYDFASEWPDVELRPDRWESAASEALLRFLRSHVFATFEQLHDWSSLPRRALAALVAGMESSGVVAASSVAGLGEGWVPEADPPPPTGRPQHNTFMLHRSDPLVRSHASELKRRFGGLDVLEYLLIDGAFRGAALGRWRFAPYDVEDIVVELPRAERRARRREIVGAVAATYNPPRHRVLRYDGAPATPPAGPDVVVQGP